MASARCHVLEETSKDIPVAIATFTNGRLKNKNMIEFSLREKKDKKQKCSKRKLEAHTDRMQYLSDEVDCNAKKPVRYMLGIYDKATHQINLQSADFFSMKPASLEDDEEDKAASTYEERCWLLTSTFGSSKRKKKALSKRSNQIEANSLEFSLGTSVEIALAQKDAAKTVQMGPTEVSTILPKHNLEAKTPDDVYDLTDILSAVEEAAILVPAKVFIESNAETIIQLRIDNTYPAYILNRLLQLSSNETERNYMACLFMYLHYMMIMYTKSKKDLITGNFFPSDIPFMIKRNMMTKFTLRGAMPETLKDKLLMHILVTCLHINKYQMKQYELLPIIQITPKKLTTLLRALGCRVVKDTTRLLTPLTFPVNSVPRKKAR